MWSWNYIITLLIGNISDAKQHLRENCANFNRDHRINIKGLHRGVGGEWICKSVIRGMQLIVKLSNIPHVPWMLIRWPRLKFVARKSWFAPDMFPRISTYTMTNTSENQKNRHIGSGNGVILMLLSSWGMVLKSLMVTHWSAWSNGDA